MHNPKLYKWMHGAFSFGSSRGGEECCVTAGRLHCTKHVIFLQAVTSPHLKKHSNRVGKSHYLRHRACDFKKISQANPHHQNLPEFCCVPTIKNYSNQNSTHFILGEHFFSCHMCAWKTVIVAYVPCQLPLVAWKCNWEGTQLSSASLIFLGKILCHIALGQQTHHQRKIPLANFLFWQTFLIIYIDMQWEWLAAFEKSVKYVAQFDWIHSIQLIYIVVSSSCTICKRVKMVSNFVGNKNRAEIEFNWRARDTLCSILLTFLGISLCLMSQQFFLSQSNHYYWCGE